MLWLFVALAVCTAVALLYFASIVEPEFRPRIYAALVVDLALPVIAWRVFAIMNRRRDAKR